MKENCSRIRHFGKCFCRQVITLIRSHPNTTGAVILALLIGLLFLAIPLIGAWLFFIVEPFLLITFIIMFGSRDFQRR